MQLEEKLQICLLALASRYPDHIIYINETFLPPCQNAAGDCTAHDLIHALQDSAPHLLEAPALLVVDAQKSEIYLLEQSEKEAAVRIWYKERIPTRELMETIAIISSQH